MNGLKNESSTMLFFKDTNTPYFLCMNHEINSLILQLHKKQLKLDYLFQSLSDFQKDFVIQTCMLNEIQSTNRTENIFSTKSDIFSVIQHVPSVQNKKIVSIIHSYSMLSQLSSNKLEQLSQVKELYEQLMEHSYDSSKDKIDGTYFRKHPVHISKGVKIVHTGFYPEEKINNAMEELMHVYNKAELDIYLRILITHFLFETIHPFYDGNGRYGRFLMSLKLLSEESTIFAYCIATSINQNKHKYYKALESARDIHEFGCMNDYVVSLGNILLDGLQSITDSIRAKVHQYQQMLTSVQNYSFTKSEKIIFDCLAQASFFTYFGISNEEIQKYTRLSKRTIISSMNTFRVNNLLSDLKLGKTTYHRITGIPCDLDVKHS